MEKLNSNYDELNDLNNKDKKSLNIYIYNPIQEIHIKDNEINCLSPNSARLSTSNSCTNIVNTSPEKKKLNKIRRDSLDKTKNKDGFLYYTRRPSFQRDPSTIREQYLKQLGIKLSITDFEKSNRKRKNNQKGIIIELNDINKKEKEENNNKINNSFLKAFSNFYSSTSNTTITTPMDEIETINTNIAIKEKEIDNNINMNKESITLSSNSKQKTKRNVVFKETAEMFFIPIHTDYKKSQRDGMWHTREEFHKMVETNLEEIYLESETLYQEELQVQEREIYFMTKEEESQKKIENTNRVLQNQASIININNQNRQIKQISNFITTSTNPKIPKARSQHDIRFKYLKYLGIN